MDSFCSLCLPRLLLASYTFKMCPPCRVRYRIYGITKRAKWKAEQEAFDHELAGLRSKEDERRKLAGERVGIRSFLFHSFFRPNMHSHFPNLLKSCMRGSSPYSMKRSHYPQKCSLWLPVHYCPVHCMPRVCPQMEMSQMRISTW